MSTEVAVVDSSPCFRQGLGMTLAEAGYEPREPVDPERWAQLRTRPAVLVTTDSRERLGLLTRLRRLRPGAAIVALLPMGKPEAHCAALRAGGSASVFKDAPGEEIVAVLGAALADRTVLPLDVARALATSAVDLVGDEAQLDQAETEWLRMLAEGATVRALARRAGYSERQMFRLLDRLYRRLGVHNRREALIQAARMNLLQTPQRPDRDPGPVRRFDVAGV